VFVIAFAAVLLIQCAWMMALPMFRGPDEIDHLLRSSNVALGHWQPADRPADEDPRFVIADATLALAARPTCEVQRQDFDPTVCTPRRTFSDGTVDIRSTVAEYNPTYYLIAGLPMRAENNELGAWAVRALGALLSALLIAGAWSLLASRQSTAWPSIAMLIATTPAIFFATTVAAPNGVGYAAGLLLWAGLLSAARHPSSSGAPIAGAVGASVLILTHPTGVIWVGASVLTVLVLVGWRGLKAILAARPRAWWASIGVVLVATAGAVVWNVVYQPNAFSAAAVADEPLVAETKAIPMAAHVVLWIFQTVGVMPNRFGLLWPIVYALWLAPLVLLLARAIRAGSRRERLAGSVAMAVAILVPTAATVMTYDAVGVAWQGRYELPLLVGIVMLAGLVLDGGADVSRRLVWVVVVTLAVTSDLCLLCLGLREARGPYDDGRPWQLLLWAAAPALLAGGYLLLAQASRARSVEAE
jgi:hypothetical protein